MTTYILAGGNDRKTNGFGDKLAAEIEKRIAKPRILSCFFASPEAEWSAKEQDWKIWFSRHMLKPPTYQAARPEIFLGQVKNADVVYIHGGDTNMLSAVLDNYVDLAEVFQGKIVIGSSAGANYLAKNFWSSTKGVARRGRGLLDVNIMVHYGAERVAGRTPDWNHEENHFHQLIGNDKRIIRLPEGQLKVFEAP